MHYERVLVVLTVLFVGGPSTFLIVRSYLATRERVTALSRSVFSAVGRSLVARTRVLTGLAPPTLSVLARSQRGPGADEGDELSRRLEVALDASPAFDRMAYGGANGTYVALRRRGDGVVERTRVSLVATGPRETHEERGAEGAWRVVHALDANVFDPRGTAWYETAARERRRTWLPPGPFSEGDVLGVSCAVPVLGDDGALSGVFMAGYELDTLSRFARWAVFSPHARILMLMPTGDLISDSRSPPVARGGRVTRARELRDPLSESFRAAVLVLGPLRPDESEREVDFDYRGEPWHGSVRSLAIDDRMVWYIAMAAPESDFVGSFLVESRAQTAAGLVGLLVAVGVAAVLSRAITRPVLELTHAMRHFERLELEGDPPRIRSVFTEIDKMGDALKRMQTGLASFARFVPRDLVRTLVWSGRGAGLGGEVRELTVFFSDIEGFTRLAEDLSPDELVRKLGDYLEVATETITQHRGTVDKYLGDGVMAFWGAPIDDPDHAAHAAVAAIVLERRLRYLEDTPRGAWLSGAATRIGLATGEVLVGTIGTRDVMDYTVMGDVANLASRLESLSKQYGTRLLVSAVTREAAGDAVIARPVDLVAAKGKHHGTVVHELLGLPSDADTVVLRHLAEATATAFERYLSRDFAGARSAYEHVLSLRPDDPVARVMRARCVQYLASPPPPDWDGVHVATSK